MAQDTYAHIAQQLAAKSLLKGKQPFPSEEALSADSTEEALVLAQQLQAIPKPGQVAKLNNQDLLENK